MSKVQQHYIDEAEAMAMLDCQDAPEQMSPEVEWILATFPGIQEGTEEWEQASQEYAIMMKFELAIINQVLFEASLNDIGSHYEHALAELDDLLPLQTHSQPGIVRRLAYAHCVTVMEAFLMYAACALLSHPPHLARFHEKKSGILKSLFKPWQIKEFDAAYLCEKGNDEPFLWRGHQVVGKNELEWIAVTSADLQRYSCRAKAAVGALTFHNLHKVTTYFGAMLATPPDWPLEKEGELQKLVDTRQDLVHRNGMTKENQPITISPTELANAVEMVRRFIMLAHDDLQAEVARYPEF
ncbi:hypothetical protein [Serratia ureilytica]|uniref:hypothetical protein n=1 Tax=Serratia ureilytica TaxID=300181 RepID=UPI0023601465|nr:hypothetical protein [Serratia ureilytica]